MNLRDVQRAACLLGDYLSAPGTIVRNLAWRYPRTISATPIVFVVGAPRSGTTLLQRIISAHDDFFSIESETGLFTNQNIFTRLHFEFDPDLNAALLQESHDLVDFMDRALKRLAPDHPRRRFVEKTPQHVLKLPFLLKHFPEAQFVHIHRDGRDCYCSSLAHPDIPQKTLPGFARYWRRCVDAGLRHRDHARLITLSYEELTTHPEATAVRLMAFLGRSFRPEQLHPDRLGADVRSAEPSFSRLKEPVSPSSCGCWRQALSAEDARRFWRIAGPTLARLGHADGAPEAGDRRG